MPWVVERGNPRWIDNHGHSVLAMLDLRAVKIDGICVIDSDLEDRGLQDT